VRLGSYIALELAAGALALGSVIGGTIAVTSLLGPRSAAPALAAVAPPPVVVAAPAPPAVRGAPASVAPAVAALPPRPAAAGVATAPPAAPPNDAPPNDALPPTHRADHLLAAIARSTEATPAVEVPAPARSGGNVFGAPDAELLAPLRHAAVVGCKANYGGTSLSLRLDFASGGRAAFKPDQVHAQSQPRREVAAYRIDRMLGIGRVPPAAAITIPMEQLLGAISPASRVELSARIRSEARPRGGQLRGAASWWIPEIKVAAIEKMPIDSTDGIVTWKRYLTVGNARPPQIAELVAQISDMVLYDFLIDNSDRWSGGNARTSTDGRTLYFMDNTLAFSRNKRAHTRTSTYLHRVQVFSKRLVERVRQFTRQDVVDALSSSEDAALAPLLSDAEIDALMARRDAAVAYLDEILAAHGAEQVLAFP
jgi:hypothetical protein